MFVSVFSVCGPFCFSQIPTTAKPAFFKDGVLTMTSVYGLAPVANTSKRAYSKIWKPDLATVKVQVYDAAGIVKETDVIRFSQGVISQETRTNEWGNTFEVDKFSPAGVGQVLVSTVRDGTNTMLPATQARYTYKLNQLTEIEYLSADRKPMNSYSGAAIIRYKTVSDPACFGRIAETTFFDVAGNPVISTSWDAHKVVYTYDARCNNTSQAFYGTNGEPLTNRLGGFMNRYDYDSTDRQTLRQVIGLNGDLIRNSYGTAQTRTEYTDGFATRVVRMDTEGHPARMSQAGDGVAIIHYQYDDKGDQTQESYFDESDKPINNTAGIQTVRYAWSPSRMNLRTEYFDLNGAPTANTSGIHRYDYIHDEKGRVIQTSFSDKAGQPIADDINGVYMIKYKYDEAGRNYSTSFWKDADTKMERWDGFHEHVTVYDANGREIELSTFDKDGKLFVTKAGYSRFTSTYNPLGQVAEFQYFNDKTPITIAESMVSGFNRIRFGYDSFGRVSYVQYFSASGESVNAEITLEGQKYQDQKLEFLYKGNKLIEERFYKAGNVSPEMILDCLKHDHVSTSGLSLGHKNQ